jgi:CubicO group peptidase (beta-lactamase class C family)
MDVRNAVAVAQGLTVVAVVAVVSCTPPPSARVETRQESMIREIDAVYADVDGLDRPGYAVGVVRDGSLWYAKGFGAANLDYRTPIMPTSVFNVASLSKQFTGASLAILIRRGRVSLTDEVRKHLPEFPDRFGPVRLEHLVYMTSGLSEYYGLPRPGGRDWNLDQFTVKDAIAAVFAQSALDFEPGTKWAYSNINYMLIAEVVARVSGMPFSEFVRREIFEPLGMADTHVNDDLGRVVPNRVTGYNRLAEGGFRQEIRRSPHFGGSGVFTTVVDLAKWDQSLRDHRLGGPELTALLFSTRRFRHDKANDAFGLVWGEFERRRSLWYEGGDLGFSSYMAHLPDDGVTVIVLSNLGTGRAADRASAALRAVLSHR